MTYKLLDDLSNVERSLDEMSARHDNLCSAVMEEVQALEAHPANDCLLYNRSHLTIDADLESLEKEMWASCWHRRNILERRTEENRKEQPFEASSSDFFLDWYQHAASCDDTFSYIVDVSGRMTFSHEQVVGERHVLAGHGDTGPWLLQHIQTADFVLAVHSDALAKAMNIRFSIHPRPPPPRPPEDPQRRCDAQLRWPLTEKYCLVLW
jgi:hypothetical protein